MPAPILRCPTCDSRVSSFDQYCGICSAVLARLRWSTSEEKAWHSTDGHVAVRAGARSALVRFRNQGVVPAGLVLRAEQLPDWVDREALEEKIGQNVLVLLPSAGETDFAELEIPLVAARLAPLFEEEESGAPRNLEREAYLPFLTNLNEWRDGRWTSRPFKLTLLAARRPWISPARSHYRFLPVERLAGEGLDHPIELHNETIRDLELIGFHIFDDEMTPTPPGYERLLPDAIVHRAPLDPQQIVAGGTWNDVLRLAISEPPPAALGWFAVRVEYEGRSVDGRESHKIECRVQGRVGRGPTLRVVGSFSLSLSLEQIRRKNVFTLENPGQIPVAVETLEILREGDEKAPERDWLSLVGLAAGEVLAPGEVRTLRVQVQPSLRPSDEFAHAESRRQIRIRHDGLPRPAQTLDLEVFVYFGRAKEFIAGIDFGTTNSVVCIGGADRSYALRLDRDLNQELDRIRSLMYFESSKRAGADGGFLYGEAAFSSAAVRPENLVRSIKTVVARDPRTRYVFYRRVTGLGDQRVTKTPQDLLDLFISELRTRAEEGVSYLPVEAGEDLGLDIGTQIALSRAVFSHPVEMTDDARRALMEAAHGAGINEKVREVGEFFETSCIDEATAAVLSYVQGRVQDPPILDVPPEDCEKVLCFDMGGGTTDLATVEVLQMKKFHDDPTGDTRVVVKLEAKAGAPFGGDDLDEMLAATILSEVRRQSEEQGAPVILGDVERAIRASSYSDFKTDFLRRREAMAETAEKVEQDAVPSEARTEDEALRLYKLATDILAKAEEVKRKLSTAPEGLVDLPGTEWPRERQDSQAEAKNFVVHLDRAAFEPQVRARVRTHLPLLDSVVQGAGWAWPSVTTLLFTGQSARVPCIREEVALYVAAQRGPEATALLPEPDARSFDPKNCVAIGAAIWGANRYEGTWLDIVNGVNARLTFDVETRIGPRFRPVPGLQRGQSLPAEGAVPVQKGMDVLTLHRNRSREPYVKFRFPALQKSGELTVRVTGPSHYTVVVDGREIKGEVKV
jgi:molecular chaperone DnaK (HSP70)